MLSNIISIEFQGENLNKKHASFVWFLHFFKSVILQLKKKSTCLEDIKDVARFETSWKLSKTTGPHHQP